MSKEKHLQHDEVMEEAFRESKSIWGFIGTMHGQQLYPEAWLLIKHGIEPNCSGPTIIRLGDGK